MPSNEPAFVTPPSASLALPQARTENRLKPSTLKAPLFIIGHLTRTPCGNFPRVERDRSWFAIAGPHGTQPKGSSGHSPSSTRLSLTRDSGGTSGPSLSLSRPCRVAGSRSPPSARTRHALTLETEQLSRFGGDRT